MRTADFVPLDGPRLLSLAAMGLREIAALAGCDARETGLPALVQSE